MRNSKNVWPLDVRSDEAIERRIAYRISALSSLINQRSDISSNRDFGVKGFDRRVILMIGAVPLISVKDLSRSLLVDPAQISRTVQGLVTAGLVSRQDSKADRRTTELRLTSEGEKLARGLASAATGRHKDLMSFLNAAQLEELLDLLDVLVDRARGFLAKEDAADNRIVKV